MGTMTDKLNAVLSSKAAIKAAIEEKGIADVGDVLSAYAEKIASISVGKYSGHADVDGLKAIGWTDEDIEYYQEHGVNWNEEDDQYHKVPQDNIDLYGVLTIDNISEYYYKDRLVYLPKIDVSGITSFASKFANCPSLVAIPSLDTSAAKSMATMFSGCYSLTCIPPLNTSAVTAMNSMFLNCAALSHVPLLDTSQVLNMSSMFKGCASLRTIPSFDTSKVTNMNSIFSGCVALVAIPTLNTSVVTNMNTAFQNCYALTTVPELDALQATIMNIFQNCENLKQCNVKVPRNSQEASEIEIPSAMLEKESVIYMLENAATPQTYITVIRIHPYLYDKYRADPEVKAVIDKYEFYNILLRDIA